MDNHVYEILLRERRFCIQRLIYKVQTISP